MGEITATNIKKLRDATGAGMLDCKKAMEANGGDLEKSLEWLRKQGISKAGQKANRITANGVIEAYLHHTGNYPPQSGALVELNCESDFVAKGEEFRALAREIALHVVATNPKWITREDVPREVVAKEKEIATEQARIEGKPDGAIEKVVEGRLNSFYKSNVLLEMDWVRDPKKTIDELIKENIAKMQENIKVRRIAQFNIKDDANGFGL